MAPPPNYASIAKYSKLMMRNLRCSINTHHTNTKKKRKKHNEHLKKGFFYIFTRANGSGTLTCVDFTL